MQQVKKGDAVKVHYAGRLTNGNLFDSSEGRDPLAFTVGSRMVIPGFDDALIDMKIGDKKTVNIPVADAYGPKQLENIFNYPIDKMPPDLKPQLGDMLQMGDEQGRMFQVKVTAITLTEITLDANHPLAGEDLIFDIELMEIS